MLNLEITEKEVSMLGDIFSLLIESQDLRSAIAATLFVSPKAKFDFKAQDLIEFKNKLASAKQVEPAK